MQILHDAVQGIHLLHWLTVAVPLATLVVVSGVLRTKKTARLLLLGVMMTLVTAGLASTAPGASHMRYGAPLPFARAGLDPLTGELRTAITVLRACFVADLLFWCSSAVLLGALIQRLAQRGRAHRARRRALRRRSGRGSTA
jgi:hypothetical protein